MSEKHLKGKVWGWYVSISFFCARPPRAALDENKGTMFTLRCLTQLRDRRPREVGMMKGVVGLSHEKYDRKDWGKQIVVCSLPLTLQCSVCQWSGSHCRCWQAALHRWTPFRSEWGGPSCRLVNNHICRAMSCFYFCNILMLVLIIMVVAMTL